MFIYMRCYSQLAPHFSPTQLLALILDETHGNHYCYLGEPTADEIWRLAERNLNGLPLRPSYIRGDEYAELLFRPICSVSIFLFI